MNLENCLYLKRNIHVICVCSYDDLLRYPTRTSLSLCVGGCVAGGIGDSELSATSRHRGHLYQPRVPPGKRLSLNKTQLSLQKKKKE